MSRSSCSGGYSGSSFFGQVAVGSNQRTPPSLLSMLEDHGTPSATIGLHQKLDMLLAGNAEQRLSIETLKNENSDFKGQLKTLSDEINILKGVGNSRSQTGALKVKLPTVVSVSCCCCVLICHFCIVDKYTPWLSIFYNQATFRNLHQNYVREQQFKPSLRYIVIFVYAVCISDIPILLLFEHPYYNPCFMLIDIVLLKINSQKILS